MHHTTELGQYGGAVQTLDQLQDLAPLDRLRELRELQESLPALIRQAGLEARDQGATWVDVQVAGSWPSPETARLTVVGRGEDTRPRVTADMPGVGPSEAARRLGITREQLYTRIKNGEVETEVHHTPSGRPMTRIVSPLPGG